MDPRRRARGTTGRGRAETRAVIHQQMHEKLLDQSVCKQPECESSLRIRPDDGTNPASKAKGMRKSVNQSDQSEWGGQGPIVL